MACNHDHDLIDGDMVPCQEVPQCADERRESTSAPEQPSSAEPWESQWSFMDAVSFASHQLDIQHLRTEDVKTLVRVLQLHGLPIGMAVAFIQDELSGYPYPIQYYLQQLRLTQVPFEDQLAELDKMAFKAFILSLKNIQIKADHALCHIATKIIFCTAFFSTDEIPVGIFSGIEPFQNADQVNAAVYMLKNALIIRGSVEMFRVPDLIQDVSRCSIPPHCDRDVLETCLRILVQFISVEAENSDFTRSVLPHAESVWRHSLHYNSLVSRFAKFPALLCQKYDEFGKHSEMLQLARDSIPVIKQATLESEVSRITIQLYETQALYRLNMYSKSIRALRQLLLETARTVGPSHESRLLILGLMAERLHNHDNHIQELGLLEELASLQTNKYGPEDRRTLETLTQRGLALGEIGRKEEGIQALRDNYKSCRRVLGEEHKVSVKTLEYINYIIEMEVRQN